MPRYPIIPQSLKYLAEQENVILTPHIAAGMVELKYKQAKVLADKISEYLYKSSTIIFTDTYGAI